MSVRKSNMLLGSANTLRLMSAGVLQVSSGGAYSKASFALCEAASRGNSGPNKRRTLRGEESLACGSIVREGLLVFELYSYEGDDSSANVDLASAAPG